MSDKRVAFICPRCGHAWDRDRASLDEQGPEVYRGPARKEIYRDPCPRCGTYAVTEVEEQDDGRR